MVSPIARRILLEINELCNSFAQKHDYFILFIAPKQDYQHERIAPKQVFIKMLHTTAPRAQKYKNIIHL